MGTDSLNSVKKRLILPTAQTIFNNFRKKVNRKKKLQAPKVNL